MKKRELIFVYLKMVISIKVDLIPSFLPFKSFLPPSPRPFDLLFNVFVWVLTITIIRNLRAWLFWHTNKSYLFEQIIHIFKFWSSGTFSTCEGCREVSTPRKKLPQPIFFFEHGIDNIDNYLRFHEKMKITIYQATFMKMFLGHSQTWKMLDKNRE